jgi:hypothetical protein
VLNYKGVAQPTVIVRGTGFLPMARPPWGSHRAYEVYFGTGPQPNHRSGADIASTLESKICTHAVPSYCIVQYQAGELRPVQIMLGDGQFGSGRSAVCGDVVRVQAWDVPGVGVGVPSNVAQFRMPCDTYTPRPPLPIG